MFNNLFGCLFSRYVNDVMVACDVYMFLRIVSMSVFSVIGLIGVMCEVYFPLFRKIGCFSSFGGVNSFVKGCSTAPNGRRHPPSPED